MGTCLRHRDPNFLQRSVVSYHQGILLLRWRARRIYLTLNFVRIFSPCHYATLNVCPYPAPPVTISFPSQAKASHKSRANEIERIPPPRLPPKMVMEDVQSKPSNGAEERKVISPISITFNTFSHAARRELDAKTVLDSPRTSG